MWYCFLRYLISYWSEKYCNIKTCKLVFVSHLLVLFFSSFSFPTCNWTYLIQYASKPEWLPWPVWINYHRTTTKTKYNAHLWGRARIWNYADNHWISLHSFTDCCTFFWSNTCPCCYWNLVWCIRKYIGLIVWHSELSSIGHDREKMNLFFCMVSNEMIRQKMYF